MHHGRPSRRQQLHRARRVVEQPCNPIRRAREDRTERPVAIDQSVGKFSGALRIGMDEQVPERVARWGIALTLTTINWIRMNQLQTCSPKAKGIAICADRRIGPRWAPTVSSWAAVVHIGQYRLLWSIMAANAINIPRSTIRRPGSLPCQRCALSLATNSEVIDPVRTTPATTRSAAPPLEKARPHARVSNRR